jgi:DNA mismatch repair ATPase MutL
MVLFQKDLASYFFYFVQHAADERIRLEELRSKVVNNTLTSNNYSTLFYAFHTHTLMQSAGFIRRRT